MPNEYGGPMGVAVFFVIALSVSLFLCRGLERFIGAWAWLLLFPCFLLALAIIAGFTIGIVRSIRKRGR